MIFFIIKRVQVSFIYRSIVIVLVSKKIIVGVEMFRLNPLTRSHLQSQITADYTNNTPKIFKYSTSQKGRLEKIQRSNTITHISFQTNKQKTKETLISEESVKEDQ